MNYKELPSGTQLFEYDKLSSSAKEKARVEIINCDLSYFRKNITQQKAKAKENIHVVVNNRASVPALIKRKQHINKVVDDIQYCEKYIQGNLCHFTSDGTYITYSI